MNTKIPALATLLFVFLITSAWIPRKKKTRWKDFSHYVYVPSGASTVAGETDTLKGFWMAHSEVSNIEFFEFLYDLKSQGNKAEYEKYYPDTSQWSAGGTGLEPFAEYYLRHPAYHTYPVVNVSHEAAQAYCDWLTGKINQQLTDGSRMKFSLPSHHQWTMAARGGHDNMDYPWGNFLRNSKGAYLCNFRHVGDERIRRNKETGKVEIIPYSNLRYADGHRLNDQADILAPANSYFPNDYGLYNMSGNASEMLAEQGLAAGGNWNSMGYDVRVESTQEYTGPNIFTGFRVIATMVKQPD